MDQTAAFGALTLLGAGGYQVGDQNGGGLTNVTDDGTGTATGYSLSAGGIITPSTDGSLSAQDSNTIDFSSDQGSGTATLSIEANTYSVSPGDINAAVGDAVTSDTGATIKCRPGAYTDELATANNVLKNRTAHTQRITITAHDQADQPTFTSIDVRASDFFTLSYLTVSGGGASNFVLVVNGAGSTEAKRIILDSLTVTGPDVPITDDDVASWPGGWDVVSNPTDYQNTMPQYGISGSGGSTPPAHWEVINCTVSRMQDCILSNATGSQRLSGNTAFYPYGDCIKLPEMSSGHPSTTYVKWSVLRDLLSKSTDGPAIHADCVQITANGSNAADWTGFVSHGNLSWWADPADDATLARNDGLQNYFEDDKQVSTYMDQLEHIGDLGRGDSAHVIALAREGRDCTVYSCGAVPWDSVNSSTSVRVGSDTTAGTHTVKFTYAPAFAVGGVTTDAAWRTANHNYQLPGTKAGLLNLFEGNGASDFDAEYATGADFRAQYTPKSGSDLDPGRGIYIGPIAPTGWTGDPWIDFDAQTVDHPAQDAGWSPTFTDQTGLSTSVTVTSNKLQASGLSSTGAYVNVTGGTAPTLAVYESNGTTVKYAHGAGAVIKNNEWLELEDTTSGSGATQVDVDVQIGANTDTWSHTTA